MIVVDCEKAMKTVFTHVNGDCRPSSLAIRVGQNEGRDEKEKRWRGLGRV